MKRGGTGWVEANVSGGNFKRRGYGRHHNRPVRFWIITMMLVLFALATLKRR